MLYRPIRQTLLGNPRLVVAYAMLVALVGLLSWLAGRFDRFPGDLWLAQRIQSIDTPVLRWAMEAISAPGYAVPGLAMLLAVVVAFLRCDRPLEAAFSLLTLGGDGLSWVVKLLVARPRPDVHIIVVIWRDQDPSFPSGHVTHYVVFYGFLFFLAWTRLPRSWPRTAALVLSGGLIALIGFSRIYLGAHWPSDVLGGYLVGAIYLVPLIAAFRAVDNWAGREHLGVGW